MVSINSPINDVHLAALRAIRASSAEAESPDPKFKRSAGVLQDRKLITISKRGGRWKATLTERGTYYLEHGAYPPSSAPARNAVSAEPARASRPSRPVPPRFDVDATELISRLQSVGGTLVLKTMTTEQRAGYRRAVHKITSEKLAPEGLVLKYKGRDDGPFIVRLIQVSGVGADPTNVWTEAEIAEASEFVDELRASANVVLKDDEQDLERFRLLSTIAAESGLLDVGEHVETDRPWGNDRELGTEFRIARNFSYLVEERPVTVPEHVSRYQPAVSWFRGQVDRHEVTMAHLPRALRILEAVAREAERRGWRLEPREDDKDGHWRSQSDYKAGQFYMVMGEHRASIRIKERAGKGGEKIGYVYGRKDSRPGWQQSRMTAFVSTGRLALEAGAYEAYDAGTQLLDLKIGRAFKSLEARLLSTEYKVKLDARIQELRVEARVGFEARLRERWQAARSAAELRVIEDHRELVLKEQLEHFELVERLGPYLEAIRADSGSPVSAEWIAWIETFVARVDPRHQDLRVPDPPKMTRELLAPYMTGWDPDRPRSSGQGY